MSRLSHLTFLFLIVVELLSLHILHNPVLKGLSIFGKEIKITQLADDTALFLRDNQHIEHAISLVDCIGPKTKQIQV